MHYFFADLKAIYIAIITGVSTAILAPRVKRVSTENGVKNQLTWIFLKNPMPIDEN